MALPQQILQPTFHDLQIRTLQLARLFCSFSSLLLMTGPFLPLKRKKREKKGGGGRRKEESGGMCGGEAEGCCPPSPLLHERIHYTVDRHSIYTENREGSQALYCAIIPTWTQETSGWRGAVELRVGPLTDPLQTAE